MGEFLLLVIIVFVALLGRRRLKRLDHEMSQLRQRIGELADKLTVAEGRAPATAAEVQTATSGMSPNQLLPLERALPPAATVTPAEPIDEVTQPAIPESTPDTHAKYAATVDAAIPAPTEQPADAVGPAVSAPGVEEAVAGAVPLRTRTLEERLGANWSVWIGGLALALGSVLLVRYSIERGFFGPGIRVALGTLLAIVLVTAGEFLRRRDTIGRGSAAAPSPFASPYIPGVLTAAGTVAAFATIYAAHAVYGFIGPTLAFLALGIVALATMAAAALHGPALAGLGLVGALLTPLLVVSQHSSPWPVVVYDLVIVAAAYALARLRRWLWLALSAAAGAALWALLFIADIPHAAGADMWPASLTHLAMQTALAAYALAIDPHRRRSDRDAYFDVVPHIVLSSFALLTILALWLGAPSQFGPGWIVWGLVIIGLLAATGVLIASAAGSAAMAAVVVIAALCLWPSPSFAPQLNPIETLLRGVPPVNALGFAIFAAAVSAALAVAAAWRMLRGAELPLSITGLYAATASLAPLSALGVAYLRFGGRGESLIMALAAFLVALGFAVAASLFMTSFRAKQSASLKLGLGALASSAIAAISLGLVFALDTGMLTVALALAASGTAYVAIRLELPALRWCVAALGVLVAARMLYDPRIVGSALSPTPIFNWLLFGYGVPATAFAGAGRMLGKSQDDIPARVADALGVLFAALLFFFEIRHAMNGGDPFARGSGLVEQGLLAVTSLGFSLVLTRLEASRANIVFRYASLAAGAIGMFIAAAGLGFRQNPFLHSKPLAGGVIVNALLLGYLLPSLVAGLLAFFARKLRPFWYWAGAAGLSLVLAVTYLLLEIRVLFHGSVIAAWLGAGIAELGIDMAIFLSIATLLAYAARGEFGRWLERVSIVFAAFGALSFVAGLAIYANPLLDGGEVAGGAFFNTLLVGYALPCAICALLAQRVRATGWTAYASAASVGAIICLFAYASLETRRICQGPSMDLINGFTQSELYAYSAVWLVLGILLLSYGIWRGSREARLASACFIVVTVLKVFLLDLAGLEGILRALSFIGLGLVLIGIGLVYQKFVFASRLPGAKIG